MKGCTKSVIKVIIVFHRQGGELRNSILVALWTLGGSLAKLTVRASSNSGGHKFLGPTSKEVHGISRTPHINMGQPVMIPVKVRIKLTDKSTQSHSSLITSQPSALALCVFLQPTLLQSSRWLSF